MSEPDKHHYLPKFYLCGWAGHDGQVVRYYRPHRDVVAAPIAPKNTGYERGLYGLDGYVSEAKNSIEKNFMAPVVDDPAARALNVLIERDNLKLTTELREAWTRFVMSLLVRSPTKVDQITKQAAEGLRQSLRANPEEYAAVRGANDPPTLTEWVERNAPQILGNYGKQLLPGIITHQETHDALIRMRWWTVGITEDFPDLLTGDRPVYLSHGVVDDRCFVAMPLSPKFIFFATRAQTAFDSVMSHGIKAVTKSLNNLIVSQADKYVYGAHDQHLRFVENRLARRRG
ncbi:hypothetical protein PTE30175_03659 [Pandoraea terrae]|uniref:DUF4238 domain-containing protein n=1 Tax=Pandoraea terrae TaxID=1537710 RepID=A0A5E4X9T7_9BURK|nr:DUF4238 domain-containing protein [Pandoraea terrae]VVE33063.1 hypothetical protein PTE30175_03659 [Pandoraea terrae]